MLKRKQVKKNKILYSQIPYLFFKKRSLKRLIQTGSNIIDL